MDNCKLMSWCGDSNYKSPLHSSISSSNIKNSLQGLKSDWFKDSAFYHIWVKSFCDSNGDGVGDIPGITSQLDYIKDKVGCDAIWLSPIFDCGGKSSDPDCNMHGYDIVNYYSLNPLFGTDEQLDTLIFEAHKRGIKLIFDFVPNHVSAAHPWFIDSCLKRNGKTDWFLWSDEVLLDWSPMGQNSNTWHSPQSLIKIAKNFSMFSHTAELLAPLAKEQTSFYYGAFASMMPDLNYRNVEVREEMKNVVRFWLNRGFDGVRIDAVRYLVEEIHDGQVETRDTLETHKFFNELRTEVIDKYAELGYPKCMIAEANMLGDRSLLESYFGTKEKPEFSMLFDFDFSGQVNHMVSGFDAHAPLHTYLGETGRSNLPLDCTKAIFLNNHDNPVDRPASTYSDSKLKLATAISLLVPSVPFVYYGNELAQKNKEGYLAMHDIRLRGAFLGADVQKKCEEERGSLLNLHKELLQFRLEHPALRRGKVTMFYASCRFVTSYCLTYGEDIILCVFNNSDLCQENVTMYPSTGEMPFSSLEEVPLGCFNSKKNQLPEIKKHIRDFRYLEFGCIMKEGLRLFVCRK